MQSKPSLKFKIKLPGQPSQPSASQQPSSSQQGAPAGPPGAEGRDGASLAQQPSLPRPSTFKIRVKPPPGSAAAAVVGAAAGGAPPPGAKRRAEEGSGGSGPASAAPGQAPKKIRLSVGGRAAPGGGAAGGAAGAAPASGAGAPAPAQAPKKIRLKTAGSLPPKQPRAPGAVQPGGSLPVPGVVGGGGGGGLSIRDLIAPRVQPAGGGGAAGAGPTLPIVRLSVPPPGAKKPKPAKKAGALGKAGARPSGGGAARGGRGAGRGGGPGRGGRGRPKRPQRDLSEEESEEEDEDDLDDLESLSLVPRAPSARHAAVAATAVVTTVSEGPQPSGTSLGEEVAMLGDEDDDDVAFTEAPQAALPAGEGGAAAGPLPLPMLPPLPEGGQPAKREDLERVVRLVQKRDTNNIFKEPVTEEVAPDYFKVIKEPMDFTTMRGKMEAGEYTTYEALQRDLRLMFLNAMTYNPPDSPFYSHARNLLARAEKLCDQARQGVLSKRQEAGEARKQHAVARAQAKMQRDRARAEARAEQKQAVEMKVLKRAGVGDHHEESLDESIRNSYRRPLRDLSQARWRGLGAGASTEGAAFGWGRQILRPLTSTPVLGSYAASLSRFAAALSGRARELVLARAAAAVPHADAGLAERLLQKQLARQPPPAPAQPAQAAVQAAALPAAAVPMAAAPAVLNPLAYQLARPQLPGLVRPAVPQPGLVGQPGIALGAPAGMAGVQPAALWSLGAMPMGAVVPLQQQLRPGVPMLAGGAAMMQQVGQQAQQLRPGMPMLAGGAALLQQQPMQQPMQVLQPGVQPMQVPQPGAPPATR